MVWPTLGSMTAIEQNRLCWYNFQHILPHSSSFDSEIGGTPRCLIHDALIDGWVQFTTDGLSLPSSGRFGPPFVVSVFSITTTVAAIVVLCMETMPIFSGPRCGRYSSDDPFFVAETLCATWFTTELLIRLASCPSKRTFFLDFKNVIDRIVVYRRLSASVRLCSQDHGSFVPLSH